MLAIYSALGKPHRGFTDTSAAKDYWSRLEELGLSAWHKYKPATRRNFRVVMSEYFLLAKGDDGKYRLDRGVTAQTLGVPSNVAEAAEAIVSAIEKLNLSDEEIKEKYALELGVLDEYRP